MNEITRQNKKRIVAVLVAMLVITFALLLNIIFQFGIVGKLVMNCFLITGYSLFAFFLIDPILQVNPIRYVEKPVIQEVVRYIEKPVQIPMENRTIEVVEKPVFQEVIRYVDRPVYLTESKTKLHIKKYNFMGSTQTRTYHKRNCKFGKMLKKKYKLQNDHKSFFKRKHYKACKTCMKNKNIKKKK